MSTDTESALRELRLAADRTARRLRREIEESHALHERIASLKDSLGSPTPSTYTPMQSRSDSLLAQRFGSYQ